MSAQNCERCILGSVGTSHTTHKVLYTAQSTALVSRDCVLLCFIVFLSLYLRIEDDDDDGGFCMTYSAPQLQECLKYIKLRTHTARPDPTQLNSIIDRETRQFSVSREVLSMLRSSRLMSPVSIYHIAPPDSTQLNWHRALWSLSAAS